MSTKAYKSTQARKAVMDSYSLMLEHWEVPFQERDLETSFGTTHVIESGDKQNPPLVLLHGGGGNSTMWFPNIVALTQHFKIYAVDIVGEMGKSDDTRLSYATDDYPNWLGEVFQELALSRSHLLGTSLGATLSIQFAIRTPEFIDQLVLVAPPSLEKMNTGFILRGLLSALFPTSSITKSFYRYITSPNSIQPPAWALEDQVVRSKAQRLNTNTIPVVTEEDLSKLPESTLLILGKDDRIYSIDSAVNKVKKAAPQVTIAVIENAGHVVTVEQPEIFAKTFFEFMNLA